MMIFMILLNLDPGPEDTSSQLIYARAATRGTAKHHCAMVRMTHTNDPLPKARVIYIARILNAWNGSREGLRLSL